MVDSSTQVLITVLAAVVVVGGIWFFYNLWGNRLKKNIPSEEELKLIKAERRLEQDATTDPYQILREVSTTNTRADSSTGTVRENDSTTPTVGIPDLHRQLGREEDLSTRTHKPVVEYESEHAITQPNVEPDKFESKSDKLESDSLEGNPPSTIVERIKQRRGKAKKEPNYQDRPQIGE